MPAVPEAACVRPFIRSASISAARLAGWLRRARRLHHSFGIHIGHVPSPSFCIVCFADLPCIKPNAMREAPPNAPEDLRQALSAMIAHPVRTIVPPWSWKAGACSAVVRALAFFLTNLQSGHSAATKAMLVEAIYATLSED